MPSRGDPWSCGIHRRAVPEETPSESPQTPSIRANKTESPSHHPVSPRRCSRSSTPRTNFRVIKEPLPSSSIRLRPESARPSSPPSCRWQQPPVTRAALHIAGAARDRSHSHAVEPLRTRVLPMMMAAVSSRPF
ncbi:hypothetical protein E2562_033163 [Oryza meyeriana var. granulata]|uniref:Uncharacterized protein n=1 Tax=Oryza meyeriana var. granulata TaxID=110450 RepID=A0A6G1DQC0_9ORYZ|nr:hypothetical protein E2562_033163 [Oryza meyeriana var. granulata]